MGGAVPGGASAGAGSPVGQAPACFPPPGVSTESSAMSAMPPFREFEKPLSDDAGRSCTMPARYYTDPDVYEREKEAIFARTWHCIGHESHVRDPGDCLTLQIADESVFVSSATTARRPTRRWPT